MRLYVGGLPNTVSCSQISQRFESFGEVHGVELVPEKEGTVRASQPLQPCRGFAYVQLNPSDEASLRRCISMVLPFFLSCRARLFSIFRAESDVVYAKQLDDVAMPTAVQWLQVAGGHTACRASQARLQAASG